MDSDYVEEKIKKYVQDIKEGRKVSHALKRLQAVDMTLDLLTRTSVGKAVNRVAKDEKVNKADRALAKEIVGDWMDLAKRSGLPESRSARSDGDDTPSSGCSGEDRTSEKNYNDRKRRHTDASDSSTPTISSSTSSSSASAALPKKPKPKPVMGSFEAALCQADKVKPSKPKKPKQFDYATDVVENYKPLLHLDTQSLVSAYVPLRAAPVKKVEEDPTAMFRPRNKITQLYSGRKKVLTDTVVPSLFQICIQFLQGHVAEIETTGSIPYSILKPVLEKATWKQLNDLEYRNPYLLEEGSDELWEKHCQKEYAGQQRKKRETWKDAFVRMRDEQDNKLRRLTERIASHGSAAEKNVRKAVAIADVKNPKSRSRRFGTESVAPRMMEMPDALAVSRARKEIFDTGSKAALCSLPTAVRNLSSSGGPPPRVVSSGGYSAAAGGEKRNLPKKGALMAKTLKMLGRKSR